MSSPCDKSLITKDLRGLIAKDLIYVRPKGCRIRAQNDAEAIECWLSEYSSNPATYRTYKKEAKRFLVWCYRQQGRELSRLDREDVGSYIDFLRDPKPRELWCGPRRKKKSDDDAAWYPFAGPLGESAIRTALSCLASLMSYLIDARYLDFNPFVLARKKTSLKMGMDEQSFLVQERILSDEEWRAILHCLMSEPEDSKKNLERKNRLRFLLAVLFFLGLRIEELSRAAWCDCKKINNKWWFFVRGKGDRLGKVPINSELLHAIMRYRHSINLPPLPSVDERSPIISSLGDQEKPLSVRQLSNLIKYIGKKAAEGFAHGSVSHHKLKRFSPHWLRHLSASRQDLAGISFTNIKSNLRHQNEQTTRIYVHAYDDDRHKEMEKLTM